MSFGETITKKQAIIHEIFDKQIAPIVEDREFHIKSKNNPPKKFIEAKIKYDGFSEQEAREYWVELCADKEFLCDQILEHINKIRVEIDRLFPSKYE